MSAISEDGLETFKTVVIGKSGVGKTTFLVRFIDNKFVDLNTTVGIDLQNKQVSYNGNRFKLELWDTAGQERYHTIVKNYFNLSKAACVVFDLTDEDSLDDAKKWMEELAQRCSYELPKLLLGNKCDLLTPADLNQTLEKFRGRIEDLKATYHCEFRVVSGKSGQNVKESFDRLTEMIYENYLAKNLQGSRKFGLRLNQMEPVSEPEKKKKCC